MPYELAVQLSLICQCTVETHVSYSESAHTHSRSDVGFVNMKTEEILFLVCKWMNCKKVNLISVHGSIRWYCLVSLCR